MNYILTFIEGIITFISPCLLPMLPIYFSYIIGDKTDDKKLAFEKTIYFIAGFTTIFVILGVFASKLGGLLVEYRTLLNIICGVFIIILGLSYLDIIKIKGFEIKSNKPQDLGAFVFGMMFSITWSPCVGAFLGSALMLAANSGSSLEGALLLLLYSLGLGLPFLISALIIDSLKSTFDFIKRNYNVIRVVSGIFLIALGLIIAFGLLESLNKLFI